MGTLLLLDGHSLAYRAFYALPADLATSSGTVTNAVYGFTSMLVKVIGDIHPDMVAVAFDTPEPTFRKELDDTYKAGRRETPDLFRSQLPLIHEVLDTLRIPILEVAGVEADDVIATLATRAAADDTDVIVVTGDRDAYQLVEDPHIKVLYNKRGVSDYALYDEAGILERTGVNPTRYVEYAALRGDTSDNLPGVPGIGEKTAAKLVQAHGTLEEIFEHLEELPPKQRENLRAAHDQVFHNRRMSVLRRDVELAAEPDDLRVGGWDRDALRELFNRLEFHTLHPRLLEAFGHTAEAPAADTLEVDVTVVRDVAAARDRLWALHRREPAEVADASGAVAFDVDWVGAPGAGGLRGLAVARADDVWYLPVAVLEDPGVSEALAALVGPDAQRGAPDGSDPAGERAMPGARGAPDRPRLVVHDAKALHHGLRQAVGVEVGDVDFDTEVMAYLLDPGAGKYPPTDLAARYLGVELVSPDREEGTLDLDGDAGIEDAGRRATAGLRLAAVLDDALGANGLSDLYTDIERPLVRVLAVMEDTGVLIDRAFLEHLGSELGDACADLERRIQAHAGETFNVNSTPQLRRILFEKLALTPVKKTKTGPSTDADSLQKMAATQTHPILEDLMRYREVEKLRSTYADALPPLIASDGRIHATFNQVATTTGRISSESPNLQNIPVRTADGKEMRRAFVAAPGHGLLTADYSQIELRILAHLAQDPGLIEAFTRGADVHTTTAAKVFGVAEADVSSFQRRFAKVVNYGLAYGMEAYGLAQRLDIPTDQAREILDNYFASFPNVHAYMDATVAEARRLGYTTTLFGRRRRIPELASDNFRVRQMGERMAQNAPVQGSAADVFKVAMVRLARALEGSDLRSRMILTVHDELVLEVPDEERSTVEPVVKEAMEQACELAVPLIVDMGFGTSWATAK